MKNLFSLIDKIAVKEAIEKAELNTSGEVRVHIDNKCIGSPLDRAAYLFKKLNMHKTELRNGVLICLAIKDKKFAIIGDVGINNVVPNNFWDNVKSEMILFFKEEKFTEGLVRGIEMSGLKLKEYFPYKGSEDINELPDDVTFGKV